MKKILIIEDDELLGDLLLKNLSTAGFDCELVRDGLKGYNRIGELMPDLVVSDLFLPSLSGFEILSQKRLDVKIAKVPIIILTNSLRPTSIGSIEDLGADDFMVKSDVTQEEVLKRVKNILNKKTDMNQDQNPVQGTKNILEGKKILVVEDDKFLGSILVSRLVGQKVDTAYANSGEAALEEIKKQVPDIVLLDVLLPGIDGFEVLKQIRANPLTEKVPVMVLSNFNQLKDKEKAESMGASFLVKALVNPDDIVEQVRKMLNV